MSTRIEATLIDGVLKPDEPLPLPDLTRVRLTIEPIDEWSPDKAREAFKRFLASAAERPIHSGGVRYTRDELHERR